jgi:hypothetical protein
MEDVVVSLVYGDGSNYTGPVGFDTVEFHGFTVANQSFNNIIVSENDKIAAYNVTGLIGLSFDSLSEVALAVEASTGSKTAGRTFLSNVFAATPSHPRYITFLLSRVADTNATARDGAFTISETVNGYEAIEQETPVLLYPPDNREWKTRIDQIFVNGRAIDLPPLVVSNSADVPFVGLLDTGNSIIRASASIVSQVYQGIKGAQKIPAGSQATGWAVLCDAELPSLGFSIGGRTYNVNPLDLNPIRATYQHMGKLVSFCSSGMVAASPRAGRYDIGLGSPFLRSAYTMLVLSCFPDSPRSPIEYRFGFGDNSTNAKTPFIKLLSTYDPQAQSSSVTKTRKAQLARAPAANQADIFSILNEDPSYVFVDTPSVTGGGGESGRSGRVGRINY